MRRSRVAAGALLGVAVLSVLAEPALAAGSTTDRLISDLNQGLLLIAIPITVLVEVILLYTVWTYRTNDEAEPTKENRRLEITWTFATALILLFVGVSATITLADPMVVYQEQRDDGPTDDDVRVDVVAETYAWTFEYPDHDVSSSRLVLPANRTVYLTITSKDWMHALHVPALSWKQDAVPGQEHTIKSKPLQAGETYQGYCAEYCGVGHSNMLFEVEIVTDEEYRQWLEEQREDG